MLRVVCFCGHEKIYFISFVRVLRWFIHRHHSTTMLLT